jgi:HK97 family phage portal protein
MKPLKQDKTKVEKFKAVVLNTFEESENRTQGLIKVWKNEDLIFIYETHAIVYALVNKIVNRIANGGYEWLKDNENIEDANTEAIENIFSGTSGNSSTLLQIREMVRNLLVVGDTYIEKVAFNPRVVKLDTVSPKYMRKKVSATGEILEYIQYRNGKILTRWTPEEMYNESLNNSDVYGVGRVEAIMREIQADLGAIVFNTKFFENSATPATIIKLKDEIAHKSKEEKDEYRKQLLSQYQGALNSGKPMINNIIEEVITIDRDLDKMQFTESRDKFIEKACAAFDMSKSMIGITDSANEATASNTMQKEFYLNAVRPYEQIIERFINDEILPDLGFEGYELHILEQNFVDEAEKIDSIIKQRDAGLISTNQARNMLGLESIEEDWADELQVKTGTGFIPLAPQEPENNPSLDVANNMPDEAQAQKSVYKRIKDLFIINEDKE